MNLELKAVYFCATSNHRWGKGYTIAEAKQSAGLTTQAAEKRCQFYVTAALFNDPTPEELTNLLDCIRANSIDGNAQYYQDDRTQEDTDMITKYHVAWLTVEKNF